MSFNRRYFLFGSLAIATGAAGFYGRRAYYRAARERRLHPLVEQRADQVRIGVIGLRGQGRQHLSALMRIPGAQVVALCDVDPAVLAKAAELCAKSGLKPAVYADLRKLLESKEVDAITTATPNHWHALVGIWACEAGKDAYIEKPLSHNVWEGRQLVEAARKHGRIVQGGSQSRSSIPIKEAVQWVRDGNLGRIKVVTGYCYKSRMSIGKVGNGKIPAGLDYDLWTGPAPFKPLARKSLHYEWHWFYDTGNGDLGNQGVHQMDIARWFLGVDQLAPRVMSVGGRLGYKDDGETPNTQVIFHDYEPAPLVFETRGLPRSREFQADPKQWRSEMDNPFADDPDMGRGVVVECEGGSVRVGRWVVAYSPDGNVIRDFSEGDRVASRRKVRAEWFQIHMANWVDAVRSKDPAILNAECLETHVSSALCHTGMISHRLGKTLSDGEIREQIRGDALAVERYGAMTEHLGRNGVDLNGRSVTLGPWLELDAKQERFTGEWANRANPMLARKYREPFVVSSQV